VYLLHLLLKLLYLLLLLLQLLLKAAVVCGQSSGNAAVVAAVEDSGCRHSGLVSAEKVVGCCVVVQGAAKGGRGSGAYRAGYGANGVERQLG